MYDPIMRVLTVLEILQARERVSGAELAERLEVDTRTVQRYIARLQDLSIPVESVRGPGGYYKLKSGFRLPPLMFTDEEAFALTLGLRALRQLGLSAFAPATEGAAAKLGRVLPEILRESVGTMDQVIAIEPGPWITTTSAESLILVSTAIRMHRRVSFAYQAHDEKSSRRQIDPYGVMHMDGRWYIAGHCLLRNAMRTFRLDRLSEIQLSDQRFERPSGFDIGEYLRGAMPFVQSAFRVEVWLGLPFEVALSQFALHRVAVQQEAGGTLIRCGRDNLHLFAAMLLSLGCEVVVRHPQELKTAFRTLAERAFRTSETASHGCNNRS